MSIKLYSNIYIILKYLYRYYICIYIIPAGHCLQFNCDNEVAPVILEYDPKYIIDRHIYYIKIYK